MVDYGSRSEIIKNWVEVVAITLGGIWAFYQFIYINKIVPANEPPLINITNEVESMKVKSDMVAIKIKLSLHNESPFNLDNITSFYNVEGSIVSSKEDDSYSFDVVNIFDADETKFSTSRGFDVATCKGVSSGKVLYDGWTLRKKSKLVDSIVLFVPSNLDYIRVYFTFLFQRENGRFEVDYWEELDGEVWPNYKLKKGIISRLFGSEYEYFDVVERAAELVSAMEEHGAFWKDSVMEIPLWREELSIKAVK